MTTFAYKGFDAFGKTRKGLTEASDIKQAREKLAASGILAESVIPAGLTGRTFNSWRSRDFSALDRARFYQELLVLIRAGLPIVKALDLLVQSPEMGKTSQLLASIRDRIKEGASTADALAETSRNISAYEKGIIAAGERVGALDVALERLGVFLEEQNRLRDSVATALIYPVMVIIVGLGIAAGLLGFAVPRIGQMLQEEAGIELPFLTRFMIGTGDFTAKWGLFLLLGAAAAILMARRHIKRDPTLLIRFNRMMFRLPIIGYGYALLVNIRFARTLALLLTEDVPLIEAVKLSGEATGSEWLKDALAEEAERIKHGDSLTEALRRIPPFGSSLARWTQVGEAGGNLPHILESAGTRFQHQWERFISRMTSVLEPALIIIISGFVLIVVLSILLPIMSLNLSLR